MEIKLKWTVEHWYNSGVHTGYRLVKRGPLGYVEYYDEGFVGNCYVPNSFKTAKLSAEAHCAALNEMVTA